MEGNLAIYQAAFSYAGSFDFKFANDDGNWSKQFFVKSAVAPSRGGPGQSARFQHGMAVGQQQHQILARGLWSFLVKVDPTKTSGEAGTVIVQGAKRQVSLPLGRAGSSSPG